MAHHLAGLIAEADAAVGDAKVAAETRAADLILRLWAKRHDLPGAADPLASCRAAIEVLSRLHPEQNPWRAFHGRGGVEGLAADLFGSMAKLVVSSIFIASGEKFRTVAPVEEAALTAEEQTLLQQVSWWKAVVKPILVQEQLMQIFLEADEYIPEQGQALDTPLEVGDASSPGPDIEPEVASQAERNGKSNSGETSERAVYSASAQITEGLQCLQNEVTRLIEAWTAKSNLR